jgi:prepilin-type N-terminal cleavage/methylation domain-containing protein/prepilin-type processing-associated H-X9-DG protein
MSNTMRTPRAFTLVELLVVIGIIGLLIGILLPTLSRARAASNRTACAAQLRDIGHAFTMYMNDSRNKLPRVNTMPSMVPPPADNPPSAVQVLQPYIKGATNVWRCPADIIRKPSPGSPAGFDTYFDREGLSYQYNPMLSSSNAGMPLEKTDYYQRYHSLQLVVIFYDYEPFHGKAGKPGSTNYLFADSHVGDME